MALGLTQQQLADRARVSRPWLVTVEGGHLRAELGKLLALFAELGLDLELSAPSAEDGESVDPTLDLEKLLDRQDAANRNIAKGRPES